jgi:hypothetical protein
MRHTRQENVVGEARLACHFRTGIDSAPRDADNAKFVSVDLWSINGHLPRILFIPHTSS